MRGTSPAALAHRDLRRGLARGVLGLLGVLALSGTGESSPFASSAQEADARAVRVVKVLLESVQSEEFDPEELSTALLPLRSTSARALYEVLAVGGLPAKWLAEARGFQSLDGERLDVVERSLAGLAADELRALIAAVTIEEPRMRQRVPAVRLMADFAEPGDLRLLVQIAGPLQDGSEVLPRHTREIFEFSLHQLLQRHPDAANPLARLFGEAHPGLRSAMVDALAQQGADRALRPLASMLGAASGMDPHILIAIGRVAEEASRPVDESILAAVRRRLRSSDEATQRTAIRACGLLEDYAAFPILLELFEGDEHDLREAAHRAMGSISGLSLQMRHNAWSPWYEEEMNWWEQSRRETLAELRSGDTAAACAAVSAIVRHRFDRHRLAVMLQEGLHREEVEVVRLTCRGLAILASPLSIRHLVERLENHDAEVRAQALLALQAITGLELPPDPELWIEQTLGS